MMLFFTLTELAEIFKVSESYLYKAVAREELRPIRIGNRLRVSVREAERFAGLPAGTLSRQLRSNEPALQTAGATALRPDGGRR